MTQSTLSQSFSYKEVKLAFEGNQAQWEAEQGRDFDAAEARQATYRAERMATAPFQGRDGTPDAWEDYFSGVNEDGEDYE
jgi:hypothetical protein